MRKRPPSYRGTTGTTRFTSRTTGLRSGGDGRSWRKAMRQPVQMRKAPSTKAVQKNASSRLAPTKMNTRRRPRAPTTPQNSTRCWYRAGTAKNEKIIAKMNTLSTESAFSMR